MRLTLNEIFQDRELFLNRWEEEKLSEQIIMIKRWVQENQQLEDEIRLLCLKMLDFCVEERTFWINIQKNKENLEQLPQIKKRVLRMPLIELIQWMLSHVFEANLRWGSSSSFERYLCNLIETANYAVVRIPNNLDRATKIELEMYQQLLSTLNTRDPYDILTKLWSFVEFFISLNSGYTNHYRRVLERKITSFRGYPLENEIRRFMELRYQRFGKSKPLSRLIIPNLLRRLSYDERINKRVIDFIGNESVIFLNIWGSYAATRRYRFRLSQKEITKILVNFRLKPKMNFLEIFGNLPIISWIVAYLGLSATVLDFHYTKKEGEVTAFKTKGLEFINAKDSNGFFTHIEDFEALEAEGRSIHPEISFEKVNPTGTLKWVEWLEKEIKKRFIPLSLDIMNLNNCIKSIKAKSYDRVLIDPPFSQETDYQNPEVEKIIRNSLQLTKVSLKPGCIGCITFPKFIETDEVRIKQREIMVKILKDENMSFPALNKKRWTLFRISE